MHLRITGSVKVIEKTFLYFACLGFVFLLAIQICLYLNIHWPLRLITDSFRILIDKYF
ncbi:MAG: hypothetical protein ACOYVK_01260 [Bacillota bacterium]